MSNWPMENVGYADHVIDGVYISGVRAHYTIAALRAAQITHVLKLYRYLPDWPQDFVVCDNPLDDGAFIPLEVLKRGVSFIKGQVAAGNRVLVVCGAGISRSATFVLAYLLERGYDLPGAFRLLSGRHALANPHPALWDSLFTHYSLPYTLQDVIGWYLAQDAR